MWLGLELNPKVPFKIVIGVVVILAIAFSLVFVLPKSITPHPQKRVVVYAYSDSITGIDPSLEDDTGLIVLGLIYETLTYYNHTTGRVEPRLAVSWSSEEENTVWIFHLRKDVVFHDGTPFNATAVKLSIERARDIYLRTGRGLGYIWEDVESVEVVDEYTVKIRLSTPRNLALLAASTYAAYVFSPSALAKSGALDYMDSKLEEWFNSGNAIGTGPYRLVRYDPDNEVVLEKFEEWWGWKYVNNPEAPDIVIIKIVRDSVAQYNGLIGGEISIACCIPRSLISDVVKAGFKVYNATTFRNFILFFNTKRYPTNITEFRLAIAHAIDIEAFVKSSLLGIALPASGVIPHGFPGFMEGLRPQYNLTLAREYLAKSGVEPPLTIELLYQVDYEETRRFAEVFKSIIESELGIQVKLNPQSWEALKDIARNIWVNPEQVPHLIVADWWPTILSPYDYLFTMFHSESKEWNFGGYEDPGFDRLIDEAWELEGIDYERALEMYSEAQKMIFENAIAIGLWDDVRPYAYSSKLEIPEHAFSPYYMYVIRFELVRVRS